MKYFTQNYLKSFSRFIYSNYNGEGLKGNGSEKRKSKSEKKVQFPKEVQDWMDRQDYKGEIEAIYRRREKTRAQLNGLKQEHTQKAEKQKPVELVGDDLLKNEEFSKRLGEVASAIGAKKEDLVRVMRHESGIDPKARNKKTNAVGLIQFMPKTAASLGTTTKELQSMSALKQLDYVEKYYKSFGYTNLNSVEKLSLLTFYPAAVNRPNNFILGSEKSSKISPSVIHKKNPGIAPKGQGYITRGDYVSLVRKKHGMTNA